MKHYFSIIAVVILILVTSCTSKQELETLTIASQKGDCIGVIPMKCFVIKKEGRTDWEYFYEDIQGFDYEPGYEYVIEVIKETLENPAADMSSIQYIFKKEKSKVKKTSENLP